MPKQVNPICTTWNYFFPCSLFLSSFNFLCATRAKKQLLFKSTTTSKTTSHYPIALSKISSSFTIRILESKPKWSFRLSLPEKVGDFVDETWRKQKPNCQNHFPRKHFAWKKRIRIKLSRMGTVWAETSNKREIIFSRNKQIPSLDIRDPRDLKTVGLIFYKFWAIPTNST